ncbi:DNA-directed RNA polymerase subunit alpha [Rickettsia prowazekii]|uniref:DNA-directed RNA polymerase subunit alpha n=2 Tax=Rickettsia prowazekii TaxID=782 RepID=RPOA_RICPR|nr:DNA-directed RNA polymerase subunit alpha [Rickettsia prowazekii]Q9ZCS9.1 RecName: Full=DNA-directed RNA polymerase subunit alpha; Short=RNAP subunit alpha; AltName: Full=RNA polymerase subunit alpha; AltName: Full=Transcriptase subunit alpha [Rickettsia prowazekii str. Madrid E]ADE30178.1 DNA-directed RNA polymerase alpha chain [Rickettsia prowazekii str. Rp22]AFE49435.1 DNA-directed RNA polymerase subunit alpha [Rickettsia prowazekii str. Chernikova]AFE50279.1 DNA-directed RNA polymerase s
MLSLSKNWNTLIKPNRVTYENFPETNNKAKIIVEPLERGFGLTLGNAMRRVLLSSLQGAAITSIKIPAIEHEFSSIPGVQEDVSEVILNIKGIEVKMHVSEKRIIKLKAMGPCVVTAGMIDTGHDVEILNPDHVICNLAKNKQLEMELTCKVGKGYVLSTNSYEDNLPIGEIAIDALFNPVKSVTYKVENTRVGQVTDYDKLIMFVETNGDVLPEMAVGLAARILQEQLQLFIAFEEQEEDKQVKTDSLPFSPYLLKRVDELELSVRSANCLKNDNIIYIGDLVKRTESDMLRTPNFGRKSLNEIKEILAKFNLRFGMDVPDWPPENIQELSKRYEDSYN